MNNYEHLIQGGIEALAKWKVQVDCHYCNEQIKPCDDKCEERMEEWLRDDYVEPDTWERLLGAIEGAADAGDNMGTDQWCAYGHGAADDNCETCSLRCGGSCVSDMLRDIARRIRELRGGLLMSKYATMVIDDTQWDEPPYYIVFKGKGDWPIYIKQREVVPRWEPNCWGFSTAFCDCGNKLLEVANGIGECMPLHCAKCGAKVVIE